jgi:hypothetical protein
VPGPISRGVDRLNRHTPVVCYMAGQVRVQWDMYSLSSPTTMHGRVVASCWWRRL